MTTLRVLLSEHWPDQPDAPWVVLDKGLVTASGHSSPALWPRTDRTEAVLTGTQIGWTQARLPQARVREQLRALPFAMEDLILREPDSQHFTPAHREEDNWSVLVIARERLRRLVAQFRTLERPLDAAWSALASLPTAPGSWTLASDGTHWLLKRSAAEAWVDDAPAQAGEIPPVIDTLFVRAQEAGTLPAALTSFGVDHALLHAFSRFGIGFAPEAGWDWHVVPEESPDLLHGEFLPDHARGKLLRTLRPAAMLVAAVLALDLALGAGSAWLRQRDMNELRARMVQLAQTQLPGRALQDPPLQLRRELQSLRQRHGFLADNDALALLGELAVALGSDATAALQGLHHEADTLVVTLAKPLDMSALQARLDTRGITATLRGGTTLSLQRKTR